MPLKATGSSNYASPCSCNGILRDLRTPYSTVSFEMTLSDFIIIIIIIIIRW